MEKLGLGKRIKAWLADWRIALVSLVISVVGIINDVVEWVIWIPAVGTHFLAVIVAVHLTTVFFHDGDPYRSWLARWHSRDKPIRSDSITTIRSMTQAEYDALKEKDEGTLYTIRPDAPQDGDEER